MVGGGSVLRDTQGRVVSEVVGSNQLTSCIQRYEYNRVREVSLLVLTAHYRLSIFFGWQLETNDTLSDPI